MEIFLGADQYMNYKFWSLKKVEITDLKMHGENTGPISERVFSCVGQITLQPSNMRFRDMAQQDLLWWAFI